MASGMHDGGGEIATELIQSRDANASEALAIVRMHMNTFKRRLAAVSGGRAGRIGSVVAAGAVGALLVMIANSDWMRGIPQTVRIVEVVILTLAAFRIWLHVYYRRCADVYRECFRADRRFRIEDHAVIVTSSAGVVSSVPWAAIANIVDDKDSLSIYLSPIEALFLPKAACENQDAEHFCAELIRRWTASGGSLQAERAQ